MKLRKQKEDFFYTIRIFEELLDEINLKIELLEKNENEYVYK